MESKNINSDKLKYAFKPYENIFPALFSAEKVRITCAIKNKLDVTCIIEHVGSTAVPNLGGKGIIDIAIAVDQIHINTLSQILMNLGYVFREIWSSPERWFFRTDLPDVQKLMRRYHVHITFIQSQEWKYLIAFRDYLIANSSDAQKYSEIKKNAAAKANGSGEIYRKIKNSFFKDIFKKIEKDNSLLNK